MWMSCPGIVKMLISAGPMQISFTSVKKKDLLFKKWYGIIFTYL